jgi:hypothetical protein
MLDENDAHCRDITLHAFFTQVPINFSSHSGSSSGQTLFTNTTERFLAVASSFFTSYLTLKLNDLNADLQAKTKLFKLLAH